MDEREVERILDRLASLGVVEQVGEDVRTSRAWNEHLQRASAKLNLAAAEGRAPEGHPFVLCVESAMSAAALPFEGAERARVLEILLLLEAVNMTPDERRRLGLRDP